MTDIKIPFTKDWYISWGSYWFKKYSIEFNILPSIDVYIGFDSKHRLITFSWLTLWFQISRFNSDALRSLIGVKDEIDSTDSRITKARRLEKAN